jgi:sirohydrochlorin cobaltochelatase
MECKPMTTALILFAHGARDPEWANPMRRVQAAIRLQVSDMPVELAFLEFLTPSLPDAVANLVKQGADKIVVMPMFIARGGHLKNDLPGIIEVLRSTYPNVDFSLGGAIGEDESVIQAMAMATLNFAGTEFA